MYSFSLLRFVPDPARGEFINIGAVAADEDGGDWDLRILSNLRRAKAIDTAGLLPAALAFVAELEERVPGDDAALADMTFEELQELAGVMNNVIQITRPQRVIATDAAHALDIICADQLLDAATNPGQRYRNSRTAFGALNRAYRDVHLPEAAIARRVEVRATGGTRGSFDFAVHNGEAVQLTKCYSFELPDQAGLAHDISAWAWLAQEVRRHGATVLTGGGEIRTENEPSIACVYVPPRRVDGSITFDQARHVFDEVQIDAVSTDDADQIAQIASNRLADHVLPQQRR